MRIRSIKPEFWTSESIARLPIRTRLTFIALWSYVDDNGVGRDNPQLIAAAVFPLEEDPRETLANVREDLATLSDHGRIARYEVDGRPFLAIVNWSEHQKIDKPNRARYPSPDDPAALLTCGSRSPRETVASVSREVRETPSPGAVEQRNRGTEEPTPTELVAPGKPSRPTRKHRLPDDFVVTERMVEWAHDAAPLVDGRHETEQWRDYHLHKGDVGADWTRSWQTWMRRAQKDAEGRGGGYSRQPVNKAEVRSQRNLELIRAVHEQEQAEQRGITA